MIKYNTLKEVIDAYRGTPHKIVCVCEGDKMPPYDCESDKDMRELLKYNCEIEKVTFSRKVYGIIYVYVC